MASLREIKRRIGSVKNIAKVTSALEAVSAARVRKAQERALASRAYAGAAFEILNNLGQYGSALKHPLLDTRSTIKEVTIVLITSDRGLAGPFNSNILRQAMDFEKTINVPIRYVTVGRKGRDIMLRRGKNIVAEFSNIANLPSIQEISPIARLVMDDFLNGEVDEVYLLYTDYVNLIKQIPTAKRMLPLQASASGLGDEGGDRNVASEASGPKAAYSFEPGPEAILEEILPRFTELQLYQAILESQASEHSARMVAMRNATENANVLVDDLTLDANKARQLAITSEMLDIVGGAAALANE